MTVGIVGLGLIGGSMARAYREDPAASRERVYAQLRSLFPDAGEKQIRNLLGDKN